MVRNLFLCWAVLAGSAIAEAPTNIFGTYSKSCTPKKGIPCRPTADSLVLSKKPDGKIGVELKLIYAAGHTCQMEGTSEWKDNSITLEAEGLEADKPCRLKISFQGGKAVLQDVASLCTAVYCGSRGTFHGVTFQKPSAVETKRK
jgi:hypothetical protein